MPEKMLRIFPGGDLTRRFARVEKERATSEQIF
jgi:hypothetical protein